MFTIRENGENCLGLFQTIWNISAALADYMLFFTWYFLHTQNKLVLCAVHAGCVQQLKSVVALSPLPSLGCFQFEVARNCFIVISVCCHFSKEKIRAGTAGDHFQVKLDDRYDEGKKMETLKKVAEQLKNFAPSSVAVELDEDSDTE